MKVYLILGLSMLMGGSGAYAEDAKISLDISGIRSDKGHVLVSVFDKADGWPMKPTRAVRVARLSAKSGHLHTGFSGLKPGRYAVVFIHDENDNHKLDDDDKGAPTEGFGFSNSPQIENGAASFDASAFSLKAPAQEIKIKVIYL